MKEKELVKLSRKGDEQAFSKLVEIYKRKVFNLAYSLTQNRDVADDIAQEAFIKAYFGLESFKFKSEFGTWLYRITINLIRDHMRKKKRMKKLVREHVKENPFMYKDEIEEREKKLREEEKRKFVHRFIRTLPEKYQLILTLRDIHGYSYQDIAKILNISSGTVDSRLHRARRQLRKKIEPFLKEKRRRS
ncbi:MAG: RNA polymerase sigma factor [Candidatus Aminicenantes bacterium]